MKKIIGIILMLIASISWAEWKEQSFTDQDNKITYVTMSYSENDGIGIMMFILSPDNKRKFSILLNTDAFQPTGGAVEIIYKIDDQKMNVIHGVCKNVNSLTLFEILLIEDQEMIIDNMINSELIIFKIVGYNNITMISFNLKGLQNSLKKIRWLNYEG